MPGSSKRFRLKIGLISALTFGALGGGLASCGLELSGDLVGGDAGIARERDGASDSDSSPPVPCTGTPEVCTDGVDNDCNGKVDCEDPACGAYVCSAAAPLGWSFVTLNATETACPTGYANSTKWNDQLTYSPAVCSCSCQLSTAPTCVDGTLSIFTDSSGTCPQTVWSLAANANDCTSLGFNLNSVPGSSAEILPLSATGGACTAQFNKATATPTVSSAFSCSLAEGVGGGCAGAACVRAASPLAACIAKDGVADCPAGYAARHVVGQDFEDTRDCSACTCGSTPASVSCPGMFTLYSNAQCGGTSLSHPANGQCVAVNEQQANTYRGYRFTPDPQGLCGGPTSASAATGTVAFKAPRTICCP